MYHENLWFRSFPVMNAPSRASAWVGLFPRPFQPTTTYRYSHLLSWSKLFIRTWSVSNRVSVWVGSLPLPSDPPLPFHRSPFTEFVICFLGLLNLPSLVRIGPLNPEFGPFHRLFAPYVERCAHPIPGIVLGGLVPLPFRPTITTRPHPPATPKMCTSSVRH